MDHVLVIEDDATVQRTLRRLFEPEGFALTIVSEGKAGLEAFRADKPGVVILDLRLPGIPGQDICRQIRSEAPGVPIIVLSATTDVIDKVLLLETGADDYVTKPFSPRELLARVRVAIRRNVPVPKAPPRKIARFGEICVDLETMEVRRSEKAIVLTAQEFRLLRFFLDNPERVISRDELLNEVWGYEKYPSTRTVDNHIMKLRHKLEQEPTEPLFFRTVHGSGYRFCPEPDRGTAAPAAVADD